MQSMANFEEFVGKAKKTPKTTNTQGTFSCQECEEVVLEGYFDEQDGSISWVCPAGHESRVKI